MTYARIAFFIEKKGRKYASWKMVNFRFVFVFLEKKMFDFVLSTKKKIVYASTHKNY